MSKNMHTDPQFFYIDGAPSPLILDPGTGGTVTGTNNEIVSFAGMPNLNASRPDQPLVVGSHLGIYDFFQGAVDDIRLKNEALDAAQVLALFNQDSDNDGLPDIWEASNGLNPQANDALDDFDNDGITNALEYALGFNPSQSDSNNNGVPDRDEDSDSDGLPDAWEAGNGTNRSVADAGEDPDNDGLTLEDEFLHGTNPKARDTDGDGVIDGEDGWALEPSFSPKRVAKPRYAVVKLDSNKGVASHVNDAGIAILETGDYFKIWINGNSFLAPLDEDATGVRALGVTDAGDSVFLYFLPSKVMPPPDYEFWESVGERPPLTSRRLEFAWVTQNGDTSVAVPGLFSASEILSRSPLVNGRWLYRDYYALDRTGFYWDGGGGGRTRGMPLNGAGQIAFGFIHLVDVFLGRYPFSYSLSRFQSIVLSKGGAMTRIEPRQERAWEFGAVPPPTTEMFVPRFALSSPGLTAGSTSRFLSTGKRAAGVHSPELGLVHLDPSADIEAVHPSNHLLGSIAKYAQSRLLEKTQVMWIDQNAGHRLNGTVTSSPDYKKLVWNGKNGDIPPIPVTGTIGSDFTVASTDSLWINAKSFPLTTRLAPTVTEKYSSITIHSMSPKSRLLAGSALSAASGLRIPVLLVPAEIVPDYNRDGIIDNKDRGKVTKDKPFRWWLNDDNDNGDISNEDSPLGIANSNADAALGSNHIDGACDLIDWFPVFLDLKQLLEVLPPDQCQYYLKQENAALNVVYTDLKPEDAGDYLRDGETADSLKNAQSYIVFANGTTQITTEFLNKIKNDGKGVILLEGGNVTEKPLYVQVFKSGQKIAEVALELKIDGVEKMYRWINVRAAAGQSVGRATDLSEPSNYPDNETNGKMFVFVHGYNVNEQQSRGWCAEGFKRLYQTGSRAMYTGVSWHGDSSQIPGWVPFGAGGQSPDYWENVTNAFKSSSALAAAVNSLPGSTKVSAAHSLGNMLVSSAIKDHGMNISKHFMFDAAVAIETYDPSDLHINEMRNPDWQNYVDPNATNPNPRRLWATEWHQLFDTSDGRNKLTWRNRFGPLAVLYNFYSSGEDVLNNSTGEVPGIGAERAWALQEMVKGTGHIGAVATLDSNGGWGFNTYWNITEEFSDPQHPELPPEPYSRKRTPSEAQAITNDELKLHTFFRDFQDNRLVNPQTGSAAADEYLTRAKVLGDAIPALSFAAGRNSIAAFEDRNIDLMSKKDGWPHADGRWHHGDAKDVAYRFNHPLWESWVELGGLK